MKKIAMLMACIILATSVVSCNLIMKCPHWIQFYSFEGIEEYVSTVKWTRWDYEYDESIRSYNIYDNISYWQAMKSVKDITKTALPCVDEGKEVQMFSASYYIDYDKPLQIKYRINDVLYIFTYSYAETRSPRHENAAIYSMIGTEPIALYGNGDGNIFKGILHIDGTEIDVEVYTTDQKRINFVQFDLVKISR